MDERSKAPTSNAPGPPLFDPARPEVRADPFPVFRELREKSPVFFCEPLGGWMLTRYDDCVAALREPRLSSDRITPFIANLPPEKREQMGELWRTLRSWTVFSDPPDHTRIRGLFNKAFTQRAIAHLRGRVEACVDELLARRPGGEIELIGDFAYPLPAMVICDMLGLGRDDLERIQAWSDAISTFIGLPKKPSESYYAAARGVAAMNEYFREAVAARRASPGDDLLSQLMAASEGGDRLTQDELVATCALLLFAAHSTTTHLLGNGALALLRNRDQLELLRADPALVDSAVEELLRYDGPIQTIRRVVKEPLEFRGARFAAGDLVFPMLNAANRDPAEFPDPERLDVRRAPNRHIGFGFGIHFCPGAPLARMEGQIAFRALLRRSDRFELAEGREVRWLEWFGVRGLRELHLRIAPA
ncbi:MAG TPA: cytochrome P450 [Polyangiaceae bacterium]|nr:cytochrome P450 [Polyangiaceae bacterium]